MQYSFIFTISSSIYIVILWPNLTPKMKHHNSNYLRLLFLFLIYIGITSCTSSPQKNFKLQVQIDELEPTSVYLEALSLNEVTIIDSTSSDSVGHMLFSGNYEEPQLYRLRIANKGQMFLYIDNENININANARNLFQYRVQGSEGTSELSDFMQHLYESNKAIIPLQIEKDNLQKIGQLDSLDLVYLNKQIDSTTEVLHNYVKNKANNATSLDLALFFVNFLPIQQHSSYLRTFTNNLNSRFDNPKQIKLYQQEFYKNYNNTISEQPIVNDQSLLEMIAPAFTLEDVDGTQVALSAFKGNYVILTFGASWNQNSLEWNRSLKQIYNLYKSKNVSIISVDIENSRAEWQNLITKEILPWAQLSSCEGWDCEVAAKYNIISVPTTFLISPEQKIIGIDLPINELTEILRTHTTNITPANALTSL